MLHRIGNIPCGFPRKFFYVTRGAMKARLREAGSALSGNR